MKASKPSLLTLVVVAILPGCSIYPVYSPEGGANSASLVFHTKLHHNAGLPDGGSYRRSVCVDRVYFNEDGTIKPIVMTTK